MIQKHKRTSGLIAAVILAAWALAACSVQPASTPTATEAPTIDATPFSSPALFVVVLADGSKFAVTQEVIDAIPEASVTIDGSAQTGPLLSEVLKAAGVSDYTQLIFTGSSVLTVEADQVTDQFILDLSNRGTYKMASPDVPKADWVKDIVQIEVK